MVERRADAHIRTTEWEDVQYKHGNRVGNYANNEMKLLAQRVMDSNPNVSLQAYDGASEALEEKLGRKVDKHATEEEETEALQEMLESSGDEDALEAFRRQRKAEVQASLGKPSFGAVIKVPGSEYITQVTEASKRSWVVAILTEEGVATVDSLLVVMEQVAAVHRDVKFVAMPAKQAIKGFPTKQLPCVLLYNKGEMQSQVAGFEAWGGARMNRETVTRELAAHGVVPRECDSEEEDGYGRTSKQFTRMRL
jgi:hypothetical protein